MDWLVACEFEYFEATRHLLKKEISMSTKVGLWIDHRKALIVTVTDKGQVISLIISAVEKQGRRWPSSRHTGSFDPQHVKADDSRQRAFTGHLDVYYDAVIAGIRGSDSILLFGPVRRRAS